MATTPTYAFPFPVTSDAPTVPAHIQALAVGVENKIKLMDNAQTAAIGGEYQAASGQVISATGLNKITLGTANQAANGITWNGTNQFTVVTAGVYAMYGQNYITSATANFATFIGNSAATLSTGIWAYATFSGSGLATAASCVRYLTVGSTICLYTYDNNQPFTLSTSPGPSLLSVWKVASF